MHGCSADRHARPRPRRRSPRLSIMVALAAIPLAATPALAEVSPALEAELGRAAPGERVTAILTLEDAAGAAAARGAGAEGVLRARRGATARAERALDLPAGVRVIERFWVAGAILVEGTPRALRALGDADGVAELDADPVVRLAGSTPVSGQMSSGAGSWGLGAIRAQQVWSALGRDGSGVRIGSIDTGVDASHPDLAGKVIAWRDFVNGRATPYDDNGHGTHTVGTMVGGRAGVAPVGVAPGARVLVAKALAADSWGRGSDLLAAGQWLADPDGDPATPDHPAVINNSWGSDASQSTWYRQMVRTWRAAGIVPVFAAGNNGPGPSTVMNPASYPESIAVAAHDQGNRAAPFSARGPVIWQNPDGSGPAAGTDLGKPDLAAPGVGIISTVGGGYAAYSGTSMAAPHVAGVVALMRQANPALTPDRVHAVLRETATDIAEPGHDASTGAGRVDALAAVMRAAGIESVPAPPAPAPPAAEPAPVRSPKTTPRRSHQRPAARVELSARQLRINQRIAQAAMRRVNAVLARLGEPVPAPRRARSGGRIELTPGQLLINQRISQAAVRRARHAQILLEGHRQATGRREPGARAGSVRLTAAQLLINQRISQAALRRADALMERTARLRLDAR